MRALLCALAALAALHQDKEAAARDDLDRALRCARRYDEQPDSSPASLRSCYSQAEEVFCDSIGETAMSGVEKIIRGEQDEGAASRLQEMYQEAVKT